MKTSYLHFVVSCFVPAIEVHGYEAWQNSLFYVFVRFFGPDPAQNTIGRD